jgi:hypothetical protein
MSWRFWLRRNRSAALRALTMLRMLLMLGLLA